MLTSTRLGHGPALTVSPYVPDLHHFRGSYGAKDVLPLYRDTRAQKPNIADGLLAVFAEFLGVEVTAEDLVSYTYAVLGTGAFANRFTNELGEGAGPVRVPITADARLFGQATHLGRKLLWWHTWGERFTDAGDAELPCGKATELQAIVGYPGKYRYNAAKELLHVGNGEFGPVSRDVWEFEVSGLKVLQSWLGYRMAARKGKKSSALDAIRPSRWTCTAELLRLLAILERTIELTPIAAQLLDEIIAGPLIETTALPVPTDVERRPPNGYVIPRFGSQRRATRPATCESSLR